MKKAMLKSTVKTETFSVGPTELCFRGNQEFLTLILIPNKAVFLAVFGISVMTRNSWPTLGIMFRVWVRVRVRVYNGM